MGVSIKGILARVRRQTFKKNLDYAHDLADVVNGDDLARACSVTRQLIYALLSGGLSFEVNQALEEIFGYELSEELVAAALPAIAVNWHPMPENIASHLSVFLHFIPQGHEPEGANDRIVWLERACSILEVLALERRNEQEFHNSRDLEAIFPAVSTLVMGNENLLLGKRLKVRDRLMTALANFAMCYTHLAPEAHDCLPSTLTQ